MATKTATLEQRVAILENQVERLAELVGSGYIADLGIANVEWDPGYDWSHVDEPGDESPPGAWIVTEGFKTQGVAF